MKNTGIQFEDEVYTLIKEDINHYDFLVSMPNVEIHKHKKYYSKDREAYIIADISIEKYMNNDYQERGDPPSIIIVIECKDYKGSIPVDDVEEFHAKLQQIGADNTKGMIFTRAGAYQKSAISYARSKGISLARILPDEQVKYIVLYSGPDDNGPYNDSERALTEIDFRATNQNFFCSENPQWMFGIIINYLELERKFRPQISRLQS